MKWQNRIIEVRNLPPSDLLANPFNWRIHPKHQQDALMTMLERVGWVQAVVVNQQTGHVVDGHLRAALAIRREEKSVPVAVVDLTEQEELLALATFDRIGQMADLDEQKLVELLDQINDENLDDVLALLHGSQNEAAPTDDDEPAIPEDNSRYGVLMTFANEAEQARAFDDLVAEGFNIRVVNT